MAAAHVITHEDRTPESASLPRCQVPDLHAYAQELVRHAPERSVGQRERLQQLLQDPR